MATSRPDVWHVQFDLHLNVEGDRQRIQALKGWKQEKRGVFIERMRSAIDRECGSVQSADDRLERMEKLLASIYKRVMSGEIYLPSHEVQEVNEIVNFQKAKKFGAVSPKGDE